MSGRPPVLIVSGDDPDPATADDAIIRDRLWARRRCRNAAREFLITLEMWPDLMPGFTPAEIEAIRNIANWQVE